MRIGVLGGSFDPIHHGHLVAASEVAHRLDLDTVVFCPTGQPWHKPAVDRAPAEIRYRMAVAATAADPRFDVSRVDVDRPGPTYTLDTLRDLRAERNAAGLEPASWFLILGADALAGFESWHEPEQVAAAAHLVAVTRPGYDVRDLGLPGGPVTTVEIAALDISSRALRARVARGEPIDYLVPVQVCALIDKHHLYRMG